MLLFFWVCVCIWVWLWDRSFKGRILMGFRGVNVEERTIGGGGERNKVAGVTFSERWVVDK